ncbi:energy transducer TonB [Spirosoma fluviale]|uniref:TonB family C-terminal domain-containing protein n=1 Tax=Spirosoma fluviale TaxID=1597977 RepID=A0A286G8Q3_9BACT|nr:energy transducer TonB [Spirosoma fluviale]SOD91923.1 TonB family C-terminal domain-containing protein [Spirosoma fluviale]
MKFRVTLFFLLYTFSSFAQTAIYQAFEADSAAEPRGGMPYLTTFLQSNLRKPIAAEAQGIGGRVVVTGIVEPDGRISDVKVVNAFRPDYDREAVRVFALFNAWKPGYKGGKPVRQYVNIPVTFKPNPPFIYENGARVSYFDGADKLIADSSKAQFKQTVPIDSLGIPSGDIVLYKARGKAWKEETRMPLIRKENGVRGASGKSGYLIGYQNGIIQWNGLLVTVDDKGAILRQTYFQDGKRSGTELVYHPTGLVAEKTEEFDDRYVTTSWYTNGQIRQIQSSAKQKINVPTPPDHVLTYWEDTGRQMVKDGAGRAVYQTRTPLPTDTTKFVAFVEEGQYENGFKEGVWKGRYADDSYSYEEQYDKGICQTGKARQADGTVLAYKEVQKQPEFKGGMPALGQFLASNLRYPADAQRARVQGRVFITFVINTDGSIVDAMVLKGVGYGADEEALRVVKSMSGRWHPGYLRGKPVRVKYNLPINFTLQ